MLRFIAALAVAASLSGSSAQAGAFRSLYSFTGGTDGKYPSGGPIADRNGTLYGVTSDGGGRGCVKPGTHCGVVYRLDRDGTETVPRTFRLRNGTSPTGLLAFDARGRLRGVTMKGGASNLGTVFGLTPQPKLSSSLNHIKAALTNGLRSSVPPGNWRGGTRAMTSKRSGLPNAASAISLPPSVASATPCPE